MSIRKLKRKKIVNIKGVSLLLLIGVGIYALISFLSLLVERISQRSDSVMIYTLGATLEFAGQIVEDNHFPHYTHSLSVQNGNTIGLKSTTINLNAYIQQDIALIGIVKKYYKVTPVLDVVALWLPSQGLIIKDNRYMFVADGVYLDFSSQTQLSAVKSGTDILVLFDTHPDPLVAIERFACSKILKTRDCTSLITTYIQGNKDNFYSYSSYPFYKHDTGYRTTFDSNHYGFLFKNIIDDTMLDISSFFFIINKKFIVDNKMSLIQEYCHDEDVSFATIDVEGIVEYTEPYYINLLLQGMTTKKIPATCTISFDVWHSRDVVDVEFSY